MAIAVCTGAVNCMTFVAVTVDFGRGNVYLHLDLPVTLSLANKF